ncbi:MAG: DUF192 domain-containing protein [Nitrospirota bacterium]|jgi:uncharacterized membrane protein (UPF0127 family)
MNKAVAVLSGILLVVFGMAAFAMFGPDTRETSPKVSIETQASSVTFNVEVAADPGSRARGLMFRRHLDRNSGMLFVFPGESRISFWMKNTSIPLDIIFADSGGKIVDLKTMEPCVDGPCPEYPSRAPFTYALEINAGLAEAYGIRPGAMMSVDPEVRENPSLPGPRP